MSKGRQLYLSTFTYIINEPSFIYVKAVIIVSTFFSRISLGQVRLRPRIRIKQSQTEEDKPTATAAAADSVELQYVPGECNQSPVRDLSGKPGAVPQVPGGHCRGTGELPRGPTNRLPDEGVRIRPHLAVGRPPGQPLLPRPDPG